MSSSRILANRFLSAVNVLRTIDEAMPAQRIAILMYVWLHPGCSYRHLEDATGHSNSTISRNIAALGRMDRHGKPGPDLIRPTPDPVEPRRLILTLTKKGERLVEKLVEQLKDKEIT